MGPEFQILRDLRDAGMMCSDPHTKVAIQSCSGFCYVS